jgi:pimeloyl-ACP methyl ester carboxylesterase
MNTYLMQFNCRRAYMVFLKIILASFLFNVATSTTACAQTKVVPFTGEKTTWRGGYNRYDFLMDTSTLAIKQIKAAASEQYGLTDTVKGQVRCVVIVPKAPASGNPWSWRGFYWDHEPQSEVELLNRGFYIGYINCDPGRQWEAWYAFLTEKHGFSKKPAFGGMSRGGIDAYIWATTHPDKVSCIYGDNVAIMPESLAKITELAKRDIPLLNVCGTEDFLYEKNTRAIENIYLQLGGRITVMVKEGTGHHPHSLRNPLPIADWVTQNIQPAGAPPEFIDSTFVKSYYYSTKNVYNYLKEENTYVICRGPGYTPCYARYDVKGKNRFGVSTAVIIVPNKPAPGNPWVFRVDRIDREALVDQALLEKGYYIVVTPLTDQSGAVSKNWDDLYNKLTAHGFAKKAVMEGRGVNAGEAFAWAIQNPEKVSCIYCVNPVMRSLMTNINLVDNLAPLAKAGIPVLAVSGSLDPWLPENTIAVQNKYKKLGGSYITIIRKGDGHFFVQEPKPVINFISSKNNTDK